VAELVPLHGDKVEGWPTRKDFPELLEEEQEKKGRWIWGTEGHQDARQRGENGLTQSKVLYLGTIPGLLTPGGTPRGRYAK